jgi:16S rRNA (cytidine1402-2'-O)-methyltransferase
LEHRVYYEDQTQIFIETPYRNNSLINDLVRTLDEKTLLCIACDLTNENEFIKTLPIREWKKNIPDINKRPAIFLIGK